MQVYTVKIHSYNIDGLLLTLCQYVTSFLCNVYFSLNRWQHHVGQCVICSTVMCHWLNPSNHIRYFVIAFQTCSRVTLSQITHVRVLLSA